MGNNEAKRIRDCVVGYCSENVATTCFWPQRWKYRGDGQGRGETGGRRRNAYSHFLTRVPTFCNLAVKSSGILHHPSIIHSAELYAMKQRVRRKETFESSEGALPRQVDQLTSCSRTCSCFWRHRARCARRLVRALTVRRVVSLSWP